MDQLKSQINNLSFEDLCDLLEYTREKILEALANREKEDIRDKVNHRGYSWSPSVYSFRDLERIRLPYNVELTCYDLENKSDIKITESYFKQPKWVKLLDCNYEPIGKEDFEDLNEWDYGEHNDGPGMGKGSITLYFYFKKSECPKNGITFKCLVEDGNIEKWTVRDGKLYCGWREIDTVDNWDDHPVYILEQYEKDSDEN